MTLPVPMVAPPLPHPLNKVSEVFQGIPLYSNEMPACSPPNRKVSGELPVVVLRPPPPP